MKLADLEHTIRSYADGLDLIGAADVVFELNAVARFLGDYRSLEVSTLVDCGAQAASSRHSPELERPSTPNIIPHLRALEKILRAGHGMNVANDLGLLIKLLGRDSRYTPEMLEFLKRALVRQPLSEEAELFAERLKSEIGSEKFERSLAELERSALKRDQVVEIARAVYGGIPKNTSARHQVHRKPLMPT